MAGVAMGFIFVPLTTAAMGNLPTERIGSATGLYNLMRNLGGSAGSAMVTTLLARGAQVHQPRGRTISRSCRCSVPRSPAARSSTSASAATARRAM